MILFTRQIDKMTAFYRDVTGLKVVTDDPGWRELDAGGITIGLHSGPPSPGKKGPKIAFFAKDVAKTREVVREPLLGRIRLPETAANVCFAGPKRNHLFITAAQSVYMLPLAIQGAAPG